MELQLVYSAHRRYPQALFPHVEFRLFKYNVPPFDKMRLKFTLDCVILLVFVKQPNDHMISSASSPSIEYIKSTHFLRLFL